MEQISDEQVFEEAAKRLKKQFLDETGSEFMYGTFRFVFHDGRFQAVEEWPRSKRYLSPSR